MRIPSCISYSQGLQYYHIKYTDTREPTIYATCISAQKSIIVLLTSSAHEFSDSLKGFIHPVLH